MLWAAITLPGEKKLKGTNYIEAITMTTMLAGVCECVCAMSVWSCAGVKSRLSTLHTAARLEEASSHPCTNQSWSQTDVTGCQTNYFDVNKVHYYGNNKYNKRVQCHAAKRVTPWLRRHDLSSVAATPLLPRQPYCAALRQDNRNTQDDVSRSAIFARQLDFCTGKKEDGVHCCLPARMILRLHVADGGVLSFCVSVAVCSLTKRLIRLYCLTAAQNLPKCELKVEYVGISWIAFVFYFILFFFVLC